MDFLRNGRIFLAVAHHVQQALLQSLILSRSISAWRSCKLMARVRCGLLICTLASTSAWRSKTLAFALKTAQYIFFSNRMIGRNMEVVMR